MGKRVVNYDNDNPEMELKQIREDIHEIKSVVNKIEVYLVGDGKINTEGAKHKIDFLHTSLRKVERELDNITGKVQHIFKWRDQWVAGRKERETLKRNKVELWAGIIGIGWMLVQGFLALKDVLEKSL